MGLGKKLLGQRVRRGRTDFATRALGHRIRTAGGTKATEEDMFLRIQRSPLANDRGWPPDHVITLLRVGGILGGLVHHLRRRRKS